MTEVEGRSEEKEKRWRQNVQDAVNAQVDDIWAGGKAEGVAEERARWLAWAADLGYDEQEFHWLVEDNK